MSADRPEADGPDDPTPTGSAIDPSWNSRGRGPKRTPRPDPTVAPAVAPVLPPYPAADQAPDASTEPADVTVLIDERDDDPSPEADDTASVTPIPGAFVPIAPATAATAATPPPADAAPQSRRQAVRRGRRVKRVVRRIELWSVLKLALVLYTCLYLAVLITIALVWGLAYSSGQIDNLQKFLADVGLENYRFYGDQMFRACAAIGAVGVLAGTVITVLTAALINVISETTGGIRLVVIEEDVVRPR